MTRKPKPMVYRDGRLVPERYARIVRQLRKIPEPRRTEIIITILDECDHLQPRFATTD